MPIARGLLSRGVPPAAAFTFLLSAPAINPVVLVATAVAFPGAPEVVLARFLASLATAIVVGLLRRRPRHLDHRRARRRGRRAAGSGRRRHRADPHRVRHPFGLRAGEPRGLEGRFDGVEGEGRTRIPVLAVSALTPVDAPVDAPVQQYE